jgi:tetratricopeptide (TPR) repeat protein
MSMNAKSFLRLLATLLPAAGCLTPLLITASGCESYTFADDARREGMRLYDQKQYVDAAGSFLNAVKQQPADYKSHYMLGESYAKLGQPQRAIQAYKSALDTQLTTLAGKSDTETRSKIIDGLAGQIALAGDRQDEITALKAVANPTTGSVPAARQGEALVIIARVYKFSGDHDNAIATYDTLTNRFPGNFEYLKEFGLYLHNLNLDTRAAATLRQAQSIRMDDHTVNDTLGALTAPAGK